jgi:hypothetical protein
MQNWSPEIRGWDVGEMILMSKRYCFILRLSLAFVRSYPLYSLSARTWIAISSYWLGRASDLQRAIPLEGLSQ